MKRFVITGTGRSGTKWCATVLRNAGIYCGHEQVFATAMMPEHHPPRWNDFEGDASLAAVPYLPDMDDVTKILVVRNPYQYVSSILKAGPLLVGSQPAGLIEFLKAEHPEVMSSTTEPEAAFRYWLEWNVRADAYADYVFRLDALTASPGLLFDALEIEPKWERFPLGPVNHSPPHARGKYDLMTVPPHLLDEVDFFAGTLGFVNHL